MGLNKRLVYNLFLFTFISTLFVYTNAQAVGVADGPFELDGEAVSSSKDDWDKTYAGTAADVYHQFKKDVAGADFFTGTASKDDQDLTAWRYTTGTSDTDLTAPQNLDAAFINVYNNVGLQTDVVNLNFGSVIAGRGAISVGYWLLQSDLRTGADGKFIGAHQDGDLLVLASITESSTVNHIRVYRWSSQTAAHLVQVYSRDGTNAECRTGRTDQSACVRVNVNEIANYDGTTTRLGRGTFIEGGVKLNDIYPIEMPCFRSWIYTTRDSVNTDANLKDFIYGTLPFCGINVELTCDEVGINAARDGFAYEGKIIVSNPGARIVGNVEVKLGDEDVTIIPKLFPKETRVIDFSRTQKTHPGSIGPASVKGLVGGKFPAVDFSDPAQCPPFTPNLGLQLTKQCEVTLEPYKFADDGTKEVKVTITGTVTNTGNVDLVDVIVTDSDDFTWVFPYIRAGQTLFFTRSIKAPDPRQQTFTDTVTASGNAVLGLGVAVAQPVSATCPGVDIRPLITLKKVCKVSTVADGDFENVRVEYQITATNDGNVDLRNVTIVDDKGTPADTADDDVYGPLTLVQRDSVVFNSFYYPSNPTASSFSDTVTATADTIVYLYPKYVATPVTATCEGLKIEPKLALTKKCTTALVPYGDTRAVQLSFDGTVTNTGNVILKNVYVTDDKGTSSTTDDIRFGPFILAPGGSAPFSATYFPDNPTASSFSDTVTATGEPSVRGFPKATASPVTATCAGVTVNKKLELTKKCVVATTSDTAGYLTFVVNVEGTVKNSGDIELTGVKVTDNDGYSWDIGTLAVGQTKTFTRQYIPTDQTAASFSDTVTATGTAIAGFGPVSAAAVTATCNRPPVNPALKLTKTCVVSLSQPGPDGLRKVVIGYEGTVTNTGNVDLKNVIVKDDKGTPSDASDDQTFGPFDIPAGGTRTFSGSYDAKDPAQASYSDTVTATANNVYKAFPSVSASPVTATCAGVPVNPKLELTKTCESALVDRDGRRVEVSYRITVKNSGNVDLANVVVVDDSGTPSNPADDNKFATFNLAAGSTQVLTGMYVPGDPTARSYSDTVTASADNTVAGYPRVTATPAKAVCEGVKYNPKLAVTKKCTAIIVDESSGTKRVSVRVEGTVTNTGDIDLLDVVVVDPEQGYTWNLGNLAIGESKPYSRVFPSSNPTATSYEDTVTASATVPAGLGTVKSDVVKAVCPGITPNAALQLTKKCEVILVPSPTNTGKQEVKVTFTGTVTNTGTDPLTNVIVTDNRGTSATSDDLTFGPYTLGAGQSVNFQGEYAPSDPTAATQSDTVTATGQNVIVGFPGATASAVTATCKGIVNHPSLKLTKDCVVVLEDYTNGEKRVAVKYSGKVTNNGDVTLTNVYVTDDVGTASNTADDKTFGPFTLAPGASTDFSGTYYPTDPTQATYSDTVSAKGDNGVVGFAGATTSTSATCKGLKFNPKIDLTKKCIVDTIQEGETRRVRVRVEGTVTNSGDIELLDVVVYDDDGTKWEYPVLAPGQTQTFTKTELPSNPTAEFFSDTVYATARQPAGLGAVRSADVTAKCEGLKLNPALTLTKKCAVILQTVEDGLKRVRVEFSGTVKNTGNIALRNVYVTDDKGTDSTADDQTFGPFTLDVGQEQTFSGSYYPADPTAPSYHDTVTAKGDNVVVGFPGATATAVKAQCENVKTNPALKLTKECHVQLVDTVNGKKVQVSYNGEVKNTGDVELRNVIVKDDRGTPSDASDDQTFGPFTLAPGQSQTFSNNYYPAVPTQASYQDTVTASGQSSIIGFPGATATPVTATCEGIKVNPKLVLTKQCAALLEDGIDGFKTVVVKVTGTVANQGDIELLNVVVKDNDGYEWKFERINAGETLPLTRTYTPSDPTSEYFTDTITGTATLPAGLGSVTAVAPVTANCKGIKTVPKLTLTKNCYTKLDTTSAAPYSKVIVYYGGTVTNTGDVTLVNVVVRDDKGTPSNTADDVTYGPFTLKPGESQSFQGDYYPADPTAGSHKDTVTASGQSIIKGFPGATASPVEANCQGIVSNPALQLTKYCETKLETQTDGSKKVIVRFSGTVKNTGDTTLFDVVVTDDLGTPSVTTDDKTYGPFTLAPGQEQAFAGSYYPASPTAPTNSDTVRATGKNSIIGFPGATATPVTATCEGIKVNPKLVLTKECVTAAVPRGTDDYLEVRVFIEGTASNKGDIELLDVVVTDNDGYTWTFDYIGVGETKTFTRVVTPSNPTAEYFTDTITGTARLPAGLGTTTSSPVTATCKGLKYVPELTLTKKCVTTTIAFTDGVKQQVTVYYEGTVTNTGTVTLHEVYVKDDLGTPSNTADDRTYGPFSLKPGESASFKGSYTPTNPTAALQSDTVTATGKNAVIGFPGATATPVTAKCEGIKNNPSLKLEKTCLVEREQDGKYERVRVRYSGRVINNGDVALTNVVVSDTAPGYAVTHGPYYLAPGQYATFDGYYYPSDPRAAVQSDTVKATGENIVVGFPGATAQDYTATCPGIKTNPRLSLTKECTSAFYGSGMGRRVRIAYSGYVSNDGDVALVDVFVTDDKGTPSVASDDETFGPFTLQPGERAPFSSYYFTDSPNSPNFTDTVTATGSNIIRGFPGTTATPVTATCPGLVVLPTLALTKECVVVLVDDPANAGQKIVQVRVRGTIANTGNIELVDVKVNDDDGTVWNIGYLGIGEVRTFDKTDIPIPPTAANFKDTVTSSGEAILGFGPADAVPVSAECKGIIVNPKLSITKECVTSLETVGPNKKVVVYYSGKVTNTGDVPLINVFVTDDVGTSATGDDKSYGPFNLAVGESAEFRGYYYPANPTADTHSDTVYASGSNSIKGFPGATAQTTATCKGIKRHPALKLEKECYTRLVDSTTSDKKKVEVTFRGQVTNTGDVTLLNVYVTDDAGTPSVSADDKTFGPFSLSPGESEAFFGTYQPLNPTADSFTDTVTASGSSEIIGFPGATATPVSATCKGIKVNPKLVLEKVCRTEFVGSGRSRSVRVYYDIRVINAGDVTIPDVVVKDDKGTASTADDVVYSGFDLRPGEYKDFAGEYTPADATAASNHDTVTASGSNYIEGFPGVTATPVTATCPGVTARPALQLTKQCEVVTVADGIYQKVKVITTGTVKNTGDIELVNVVVKDDDGTEWKFDYLAIGQTETFTKSEFPSNSTAAYFQDTVTATGDAVLGFGKATASAVTATCKGVKTKPELVLDKECVVVLEEHAGSQSKVKVLYQGKVTNTGDVTLHNVYVVDDLGTPADQTDDVKFGPFSLVVGGHHKFEGYYYPSNPTADYFSDTVTATGDSSIIGFPGATATSVTAKCNGIKVTPALELTKECESVIEEESAGHKKVYVKYRGYVRNTGNVGLINVYVVDDLGTTSTSDDVSFGPFVLNVGEQKTFEGKYIAANPAQEYFSDTVTATGTNVIAGFPGASAGPVTAKCKGIKTRPELKLEKDCVTALTFDEHGQRVVKITFKGRVRNTGDVDLVNVYVVDDRGTPSSAADDLTFGPFNLKVGEYASFTGSYYATDPTADHYSDTVRAYGASEIKGLPGATATSVTATCEGVVVHPSLAVEKECVTFLVDDNGRKRVVVEVRGFVTNSGDIELENVKAILADNNVIDIGDLDIGETFDFKYTVNPSNPTQGFFEFSFYATGDSPLGLGSVTSPEARAVCEGIRTNPKLLLTKECTSTLESKGDYQKVVLAFEGKVTNVGDVDLVNVYVKDDAGTPDTFDDRTFGPFNLKVGESADFSGRYYPRDPTAPYFHDTVSAKGDNIIIGFPGTVARDVTATCRGIRVCPSLALEKQCVAELRTDDKGYKKEVVVTFKGRVINDGDVTLRNVIVYDDYKGTPGNTADDHVYGPFILKPGEYKEFSGEYDPTDPTAPYFHDTVTASASSGIEGFPGVTARPVAAQCPGFVFTPKLELQKECDVVFTEVDTKGYGNVTVLKVSYSGLVMNTGDVNLINVVVTDDKGTDDTTDDAYFGPFNIAAGKSEKFEGYYYPRVGHVPYVRDLVLSDTVTARADVYVIGFGSVVANPVTAQCKVCP